MFYQEKFRMRFKTLLGYTAEFSIYENNIAAFPPVDLVPAADPIILRSQNNTDEPQSINGFEVEVSFIADKNFSVRYLLKTSQDDQYPYFYGQLRVYANDAVSMGQVYLLLDTEGITEEWTDRKRIVTLRFTDGIANLKSVPFNLYSLVGNCETITRYQSVLDIIRYCLGNIKAKDSFYDGRITIISNLNFEGSDPLLPMLDQIYVNPSSFNTSDENPEQSQDCYTVLETILNDFEFSLFHGSSGGWVLVRISDLCRINDGITVCTVTYFDGIKNIEEGPLVVTTNNPWKIIGNREISTCLTQKRGDSIPVQENMLVSYLPPIKESTATVNFGDIYLRFPNNNLFFGPEISNTPSLITYEVECWTTNRAQATLGSLSYSEVAATLVPVHYKYLLTGGDVDREFVKMDLATISSKSGSVWNVDFLQSPAVYANKGTTITVSFQLNIPTGVIGTKIPILFIKAGNPAQFIQADGTRGPNFHLFEVEIPGSGPIQGLQEEGQFGPSTLLDYYYTYEFQLKPQTDEFLEYRICLCAYSNQTQIKDFIVNAEFFENGQRRREIIGYKEVLKTQDITPDVSQVDMVIHDTKDYNLRGNMIRAVDGVISPTTLMKVSDPLWVRDGYASDVDNPKTFAHMRALSAWILRRRFFNRVDLTAYGVCKATPIGNLDGSCLPFWHDLGMTNGIQLMQFIDHRDDANRLYVPVGFREVNLRTQVWTGTILEVLHSNGIDEVNPDETSPTRTFQYIYNEADRDQINRRGLETRYHQQKQGGGWWWIFGPLGYVVWGRKKKKP